MGSRWMRNSFVYLLILVAVIAIVVMFFRPSSGGHEKKDLSTFIADARAGAVQKVEVTGNTLKVTQNDGKTTYTTRKEDGASIYEILNDNGIASEQIARMNVEIKEPSS